MTFLPCNSCTVNGAHVMMVSGSLDISVLDVGRLTHVYDQCPKFGYMYEGWMGAIVIFQLDHSLLQISRIVQGQNIGILHQCSNGMAVAQSLFFACQMPVSVFVIVLVVDMSVCALEKALEGLPQEAVVMMMFRHGLLASHR